ncbi:MAG: hypothetical protein VKO65_05565 [Cyanobacteriota bacterium]|nr:hypothetical protein [Cyanobacteriota bacterium]
MLSNPARVLSPQRRRCTAALLGLALLLPLPGLARGGGGGGGFGGGFGGGGHYNFGGDGFHSGSDGWHQGYDGYHPAYGPDARPSWNNDTFNRTTNVNVNNNFYNRDYHGWNQDWANGGYWGSRPWNTGWYGTGGPGWRGWGWWGTNAAAWGVAGLATGVAISSLVNQAADSQSVVIVVPGTTYQLNYGSVESVGTAGASFNYSLGGGENLMGAANCQAGLLNGQVPSTAQQAQLLNAVCQVAYGSAP